MTPRTLVPTGTAPYPCTMADTAPHIDDARAKRNVAILIAMSGIMGGQLPMIFVIGGLAGTMLAPHPCLVTLPLSLIVFGSMTTAPWLSGVMQHRGRKTGFVVGALGGATGAAVAAYALMTGSFALLLVGSYLTGIYQSSQGFFRFAAADRASATFKPKAISYVLGGGLIAAVMGTQLNKVVMDALVIPFLGTYLAVIAMNLIGMTLVPFLDLPRHRPDATDTLQTLRTRRDLLKDPRVLVAVICGMVTYALMNLVMTSTPLAVVGCGFTEGNANDIVMAHVLAMFAPSFVTGHLINRFGVIPIMATGLAILAGAGVVALSGITLTHFFGALILLGVGWNFGFIGATTLLATSHSEAEKGRVQGMNDAFVFGCVTLASLASGGLLNCSGGDIVEGWSAVNLAMAPFLTLAGGALIWLALRPKTAAG